MHTSVNGTGLALGLKAGDLVEVKSKEEILATLDENSCLDALPFMPEMFRYCGQRFTVYKRAHKTCDTVFPIRSRRMANAVHLETRCDGGAHGGCEAGCLIFWKEAWLRRVTPNSSGAVAGRVSDQVLSCGSRECGEADVWKAAQTFAEDRPEVRYTCQATQLPYYTTELKWSDLSQYIEDLRSRNVAAATLVRGLIFQACNHLKNKGLGIGRLARGLYQYLPQLSAGVPWPLRNGLIAAGERTPTEELDLQPGELVRVKSLEEILRTVNTKNRNRGLGFDREMVPYCGREYRVLKRVNKIINDKTGEMQEMRTPCIVLDSVVCQSQYSECRMFCPRSIYSYWREIWLERVNGHTTCEQPSTN